MKARRFAKPRAYSLVGALVVGWQDRRRRTRDCALRADVKRADFVVLAADWDTTHTSAPELSGQLFHFFEAPNRFGLPPFYALHVWAWKDNLNGTFTNWNPSVSCDGFNGRNP